METRTHTSKYLGLALAFFLMGLASLTLADNRREHYRDYGKGYDRGHHDRDYYSSRHYGHRGKKVIINNYAPYYGHPRHIRHHRYHGDRYVIHHHDHSDAYKWIGGIYILNEILHHNH
ncbi:MAG: hypothetical protein AB7U63_09535 [Porticoccaceae bacterium]